MKKLALCIVDDDVKIDTIVGELKKTGFTDKDISILHAKEAAAKSAASLTQAGAVSGASVGALTGSALGLLAGLGVMTIPGIGPFLAAGPLMTALSAVLSGTAVGSGVGLIAGALVGLGMREPEAKEYEKHLTKGKTLIAVESNSDEMISKSVDIYNRAGATEIHPRT